MSYVDPIWELTIMRHVNQVSCWQLAHWSVFVRIFSKRVLCLLWIWLSNFTYMLLVVVYWISSDVWANGHIHEDEPYRSSLDQNAVHFSWFLSASLDRAHTSKDHFSFWLRIFMNCGAAGWVFVCSLKLSSNGLGQYLDGWPSEFYTSCGMCLG